ncbi:hypothetical protein BC8716_20850 [Shouchella clausii]|nr:hypothetical protein BC8716_20850 [Shouchella clausii]PAF14615.1 hypothetical protein CHH59_07600 [Shouchella clausii]QNM44699.1 hypothetical protein DUT88_18165 [Shouchella clausii]
MGQKIDGLLINKRRQAALSPASFNKKKQGFVSYTCHTSGTHLFGEMLKRICHAKQAWKNQVNTAGNDE